MKFEDKNVVLKDGNLVTIREARVSDATNLIDTVSIYIEESEFIPQVKGEFAPTQEEEEVHIQSLLDGENNIMLLAIRNDRIIGNIDLHENKRQVMLHTAGVGMGMLKEWTNMGLGSALMNAVIDWAKGNPKLESLWLEVYATNELGIAMYKKCGFVEIGRHPDFFKIGENEYADQIKMYLSVK